MAHSTGTAEELTRVWDAPEGVAGLLGTVDHKKIGMRYIVTAFLFFLLGGLEALLLRTQLALPENAFLGPEAYDQLFTMHGTTMIFFFATPILFGFGNYLVPLMIGARDMAYPRLNAFGYWVFLFAGLFMYASLPLGLAPDGGWFAYTPLTTDAYSPGLDLDFWVLGLLFLGIGTTAGAINFIVTIFKGRAPGMTVARMPIFVWSILATSFAVLFAVPALNVANLLLLLERSFGFHFYGAEAGGSPLLWQHLFWVFGHPDVYIIVLPALGIVSEIVPAFSRRRLIGYVLVAMATLLTAVVGFGVWAHHMFAVGLPPLTTSFFSAASFIIAVPSGIQIFAWLSTMLSGRPVFRTPLVFVAGFVFIFVLGGLSGVMFPLVAFDRQVTDSYFVVAHLHYVLVGGMVFPLFGGLYYWLPKMTGRLLSERLGAWNFWLMFVGFNVAFFPMHVSGLLGMPRRVYTYEDGLGWNLPNLTSTVGAAVLALGIALFLVNLWVSASRGEPAGDDPWRAGTLEWATSSPPPAFDFRSLPPVTSPMPLWDVPGLGHAAARPASDTPATPDPTDPFERESPLSSPIAGRLEGSARMPFHTTVPLWLSLAIGFVFVGFLVDTFWLAGLGAAGCLVFLLAWLRPMRPERTAP